VAYKICETWHIVALCLCHLHFESITENLILRKFCTGTSVFSCREAQKSPVSAIVMDFSEGYFRRLCL